VRLSQASSEEQKDIWYLQEDFFIRSVELLHAITATLRQKMNVLFVFDNYALLDLLAFYAKERSLLIRKHTVGLLAEIIHWV